MTGYELNNAIESVINKFVEESSIATLYQDDYGNVNGDAIAQQNKAIENALRSLQKILVTDKQN